MVRRTPRQLEIADHLWDCLTRIAEDCGTDRNAVVNQAVYEFARRFNFLTPMAKEVPMPDDPISPAKAGPASAVPGPAPGPGPRPPKNPPPAANPPKPARPAPAPAPAPPARKTLYVVNSAGDMHKIEKDTFIIGRSRTCDLVIPSSKVSRQHGSVVRENGEYFIEDLGSANGVWRDGVKIQKEKVRDGDEFMISEEVLKFIFR
ncbi:MAG: FHA domain-containing protein [Deltaproteobacteria bacterium]|nr:FHA domain-containing protein [Deltaproteobacteria bacterium]